MAGAFDVPAPPPVEQSVAVPQFQGWQRPIPLVLGVLLLVAVTGLTVWSLTRPGSLALTRFEVPLRVGESFEGYQRHIVAMSADGRQIVYTTEAGLSLRSLNQLTPVLVAGTDGSAREPFFSPDGEWIGFYADGRLRKVATSGGAPVSLGVAGNPWGASWGADDMILYGQRDGIWQVSGTSGTPAVVIKVEDDEQVYGPQMLPGGEWVLFTLRPAGASSWNASQVVVQSLETGERVTLIEGGRDARYVETGHLVYGLNGVVFAVAFDLDARHVLGGPVPLVEGVQFAENTGAAQFSIARNGSLVYVPGPAGAEDALSLMWVTRTGEETPTAAPVRNYDSIRVSPDGTRVAAVIDGDDNTDVWIWHLDQGPLSRLTFHEAADFAPLWTLDSSRVVFSSNRDGGGLFWRAADGTGEVEPLLESTSGSRPWGWTADGRLLFDQPSGVIGVLTVEGDRTVEMLLETESASDASWSPEPALSPDGRWLAYQSNESGRWEIFVQPFPDIDDGKWQVSTNGGYDPVWSPDGRDLFYLEVPERIMVAEVETDPTFNSGTPTEAFDAVPYALFGPRYYDLAPDGERFLMTKAGVTQTEGEDRFTGMIVVENWFEELKERVPVP